MRTQVHWSQRALLGLYLAFLALTYLIAYHLMPGDGIRGFVYAALGCMALAFAAAWAASICISRIRPWEKPKELGSKRLWAVFLALLLLNSLVVFIWYSGFAPGNISTDSLVQAGIAVSGECDDRHPFLHTFLFFVLPLELTGYIWNGVVWQLVFLAVAVAYMSLCVCRHFGVIAGVLADLIVMLDPGICKLAMFPWKDIPFGIAAMLVSVYMVNCYYSHGQWLKKKRNILILAMMLVLATVLRHNGILFTAFAIAGLFFLVNKRDLIKTIVLFLVLMFLVKGPLYSLYDVQDPGQRNRELLGVPMNILATAAKYSPESLDQETVEMLESITPLENYKEHEDGNFNKLKWSGISIGVLETIPVTDTLRMTFNSFKTSTVAAVKGLVTVTDLVYGLDCGRYECDQNEKYFNIPSLEYKYRGDTDIYQALQYYNSMFHDTALRYIRYIGVNLLAVLAFVLARCDLRKREGWLKVLLALPLFTYDFGTMLLLTGPDYRFFYMTMLISPMLVLMTFRDREEFER